MIQENSALSLTELPSRLENIRRSRSQISLELESLETLLAEFMGCVDALNLRLHEMPKKAPLAAAKSASLDDFKANIEKIVQGSLEAFGDKLSAKVLAMLQELKGLSGTAREDKIQQIKEAADSEMVDLSKLYIHEEVQSNLGEVGVEEKESKGIESSLERLKKLRARLKPGKNPEPKEG